jgi:hypothetical protein
MIVRRIREHLVAHSWFAVAVDFLIVVVGVLIGMQASNWNNRRIEHHQSLSYRSRLIDELDFNARQFAQQIAYYEQVRGHALATMRALESRSSESSDFFVHAYQSTQIDITPPKRFIYDEMVSSGLVERLGSEKAPGAGKRLLSQQQSGRRDLWRCSALQGADANPNPSRSAGADPRAVRRHKCDL